MSLSPDSSTPAAESSQRKGVSPASMLANSETPPQQLKTLSSALALLAALRPRIMSILSGYRLRVALDRMDIMKPTRGDLDQAHVLWVGPLLEGADAGRLREVCGMSLLC
jgi:activating signal cointegrator complex subunit 1